MRVLVIFTRAKSISKYSKPGFLLSKAVCVLFILMAYWVPSPSSEVRLFKCM